MRGDIRSFIGLYTDTLIENPFENEIFALNEINIQDELGEWKYDLFQNVVKIFYFYEEI